jgi:hypothetical protein
MTRSRRENHALVPALLLLLGACASTPPPTGMLDAAERAIADAREARADEYAPVELGFAEEKLAAARAAMGERDYDDARSRAGQAELDAALALARSRAAAGRAAVRSQSEENARLRRELLGSGDGA